MGEENMASSDSMALTDVERGRALDIKKAMMEADEAFATTISSDLEYTQHALVAKNRIQL
jgi:hypothetical protein